MIQHTGHADLPLHSGTVPKWLADRMKMLGTHIIEVLIMEYGQKEVLIRLSDPLWFQSLGAVLGMDWHSSGITTSVMYALKRGINERANDFGLFICGGRGTYSRQTPEELLALADRTGLNANELIRASKLSAKIDNSAVQDGFSLYQHNFILSAQGDWAVVQQGMNIETKTARRYHWCSAQLRSFTEEPHSGVTGENKGSILNLTDSRANETRNGIMSLAQEKPHLVLKEIEAIKKWGAPQNMQLELFSDDTVPYADVRNECGPVQKSALDNTAGNRNITLPRHHEVLEEDVDTKRLGAVLCTAYESEPQDFESLLLTKGLGPRTLQSLTLVSEVIYGTPSRFRDPARFSFAHGGKDGNPFPVPTRIYDESIRILGDCIEKSKLGYKDKSDCLKKLHQTALAIETHCKPQADFCATIAHEKQHSQEWGGRTCFD